jgi:hypothetical protein
MYLYRYDNLESHLNLEGDALRARYWSRTTKESHPHRSLIAAEQHLPEAQGIFRICFWKDVDSLRRWVPKGTFATSPFVVQRVRHDHPFFTKFQKEVDDCLPDSAWLYWRVDKRCQEQEWTLDGIAADELEVLDYDGQWKAYTDASVTAPSERRFRALGLEPWYQANSPHRIDEIFYGMRPLADLERKSSSLAMLVVERHDAPISVVGDGHSLQALFERFLALAADVPVDRLRLFVFRESTKTFSSPRLAEVAISKKYVRRRFGPLGMFSRPELRIELVDEVRWHSVDEGIGAQVLKTFNLPLARKNIERYEMSLFRAGILGTKVLDIDHHEPLQ